MRAGEVATWSRLQAAGVGLSFAVPDGTQVVCQRPLMLGLAEFDGMRPIIAFSAVPLAAELAPADWIEGELATQARELEAAQLIAREPGELFGREATLTLVSHVQRGQAFTLVQWWTRLDGDGDGVVVSATCATPHYPHLADVFAAIVGEVCCDGAL